MLKYSLPFMLVALPFIACNNISRHNSKENVMQTFSKGSFGYDLNFLKKYDSVIVLKQNNAQIVISAKYQGKVFTSTVEGEKGKSFGWINYKAFEGKLDKHMNAYGGENRLWLGPEGNRFSLFFKKGQKQVFDNWITPDAFDHDLWVLEGSTSEQVVLSKKMELENYAGTYFDLKVTRKVSMLDESAICGLLKLPQIENGVKAVAYSTENTITNIGTNAWTATTGAPCIWMLDMFPPSDGATIIIPYNQTVKQPATTNYFGEIPSDRIVLKNGCIFFKVDGKLRGKLGITPLAAKPLIGSYDAQNKILTIVKFDLLQDEQSNFLNQEWNTAKPPYTGDAVNAYNDGPLANGTQMGPFYEMESVSPAAFLKPHESLTHHHCVTHFTGSEAALNKLAQEILGVSIQQIPFMK